MPGKKLLVADDSLTIQKVIRLALSNEGYEIQNVSEGNDAIQQVAVFRPDIVLIDISLPGKSAFDVKQTINKSPEFRKVRFILMSSAFEQVDENQASSLAFDGRLTKPFDPAHLRQVLSSALESSTPSLPLPSVNFETEEEETPPPLITSSQLPPALPEDLALPEPENSHASEPSFELPPLPGPPSSSSFEKENSDQWDLSLKPDDLPPLPDLNSSILPPLPEPDASSTERSSPDLALSQLSELPGGGEEDIKKLSDSTFKISSENASEYQWTVQEPSSESSQGFEMGTLALKIEPQKPQKGYPKSNLPPLPQLSLDSGEEYTPPEIPQEHPTLSPLEQQHEEPTLAFAPPELPPLPIGSPPIPNVAPPSPPTSSTALPPKFSNPGTTGNASIPSASPPPPPPSASSILAPGAPPLAPSLNPTASSGLSQSQIEELVREQVRTYLEKMSHNLLPDLAEKVIKQEIHKMLAGS